MRFIFRTDANATIGTGHLMRCLALAQALRDGGAECVFLCRITGLGNLAGKIAADGHLLLPLPESDYSVADDDLPHANWLPGGQLRDASACQAMLMNQGRADWLVVDHYAIDYRWQSAMRATTSHIMVVDDLADRSHDCDLLLDQNLIDNLHHRYDTLVPSHCIRLLGPKYALLRKEFARHQEPMDRPPVKIPRLLVMFGGADTQNLALRAVNVLVSMSWTGIVDVVAGPLYVNVEPLHKAVSSLPNGCLHTSVDNMAELMRNADLALGSPGVASWERCACALPAITIAQAHNQEAIGKALGDAGANSYLGRVELLTDGRLQKAIAEFALSQDRLKAMTMKASNVCDGNGVGRTVRGILETP